MKIIETATAVKVWPASIRCAESGGGYNELRRVDGCFALFEAEKKDFSAIRYVDNDPRGPSDDVRISIKCPACDQELSAQWQLERRQVAQLEARAKEDWIRDREGR